MLDFDAVLATSPVRSAAGGEIGRSRRGRPLYGFRAGRGPCRVSLIGGCHADEPVGPAMLDRLAAFLLSLPSEHNLLQDFTWSLVPHANPDGEAANRPWTDGLGDPAGWTGSEPVRVDLWTYLSHVVREPPGDDMEFGFPRSPEDGEARPENHAIAAFLREGGPYHVHGSLHGMGVAAGPWFLMERSWADHRTESMRRRLQDQVRSRGYALHDIDRQGDKGFHRLGEGFTSRPDSTAMRAHFESRNDLATAALFRPSSMEWVRGLGGDPLTLVTEMPLFLLPKAAYAEGDPIRPPAWKRLREAFLRGRDRLAEAVQEEKLESMPIRDQMEFQLRYLNEALITVADQLGADQLGAGR